ncbi:unnamed protein product [Mycena citricolor]|uniref:Uncharacterized protein n=1 Tax=Mycena citricolor TaxID=2018698 RepID=A0AAD2H9A4_9AGAR|nr:unnamed protein product [Mycena citricolor]
MDGTTVLYKWMGVEVRWSGKAGSDTRDTEGSSRTHTDTKRGFINSSTRLHRLEGKDGALLRQQSLRHQRALAPDGHLRRELIHPPLDVLLVLELALAALARGDCVVAPLGRNRVFVADAGLDLVRVTDERCAVQTLAERIWHGLAARRARGEVVALLGRGIVVDQCRRRDILTRPSRSDDRSTMEDGRRGDDWASHGGRVE